MKSFAPDDERNFALYADLHQSALADAAEQLQKYLVDIFSEVPRIDRIQARAKAPESFQKKALKEENGSRKYQDPFSQIQDMIGARIITFYNSDVLHIDGIIKT